MSAAQNLLTANLLQYKKVWFGAFCPTPAGTPKRFEIASQIREGNKDE